MNSSNRPLAGDDKPMRVMIVDDAPENLMLLQDMLSQHGCEVFSFDNGMQALRAAKLSPPDLILLDITMPEMDGFQVCESLKVHPRLATIPVIFLSALNSTEDKVRGFAVGGVDFITKPFQFEEVQARIDTHFRLAQLQAQLEYQNQHLKLLVDQRTQTLSDALYQTILTLSCLLESRETNNQQHILRTQHYCLLLADCLRLGSPYFAQLDKEYVEMLFHAAPLHDIGKIVVPEAVLLKQQALNDAEWQLLNRHAELGEQTLQALAAHFPDNVLLRIGVELTGGHHEKWDGSGFPRGLIGEAIPLSARIMALADSYDVLRAGEYGKVACTHAEAVAAIQVAAGSQLDPVVVRAFLDVEKQFEHFHEQHSDHRHDAC